MSKFSKERDRVFTEFVQRDDIKGVLAYCMENGVPLPASIEVLKAGIYKAVQECTAIPDEIKALAREKCMALGFKPTMFGGESHDVQ